MQQRKRRPQKVSDTCPKCGYCDKCGQSNAAPIYPYPYVPYVPPVNPYPRYPWQTPWITWGGTTLTSTTCEVNPSIAIWNGAASASAMPDGFEMNPLHGTVIDISSSLSN